MRITNKTMMNNILRNIERNLSNLNELNQQISTGKRFSKPSDDPGSILLQMRSKTNLRQIEQYRENIAAAAAWLEDTDVALGQINDVLHHIRELAVQAGDGALDQSSLLAIRDELVMVREHILEIANTAHAGKSLFAGQKTASRPFKLDDAGNVLYEGDDTGRIEFEVGMGMTVKVNVPGREAFEDIFSTLQFFIQSLESGDGDAIDDVLEQIDGNLNTILRFRSEVGAKANRMEMAEKRMMELEANIREMTSKVEDVDIAKVLVEMSMKEAIYQASLMTGAKIIQPTILDFLR